MVPQLDFTQMVGCLLKELVVKLVEQEEVEYLEK